MFGVQEFLYPFDFEDARGGQIPFEFGQQGLATDGTMVVSITCIENVRKGTLIVVSVRALGARQQLLTVLKGFLAETTGGNGNIHRSTLLDIVIINTTIGRCQVYAHIAFGG